MAFQQVIPQPQNLHHINGASKPLCQEKKKKKTPKSTRYTFYVMKLRNAAIVRRLNGAVSFTYGATILCKDLGMKLQIRLTVFLTFELIRPLK